MIVQSTLNIQPVVSDVDLAAIRKESGFDELVTKAKVSEPLANACFNSIVQSVLRRQTVSDVKLAPNGAAG